MDVHDFPSDAVGSAIPYGVYDVAANNAFVSVGTDHDTPVFAVTSIEAWWMRMGAQRYPNARELFITADAGGSNGYRLRVWKAELQRLADKIGISDELSLRSSGEIPRSVRSVMAEPTVLSGLSNGWRIQALVASGSALQRATFDVAFDGRVEMIDDELLVENFSLRQSRMDHGLRIWSDTVDRT